MAVTRGRNRPAEGPNDIVDPSPGPLEQIILKEAAHARQDFRMTPRAQVGEYLRDQVAYGHITTLMARRMTKHLLKGLDVGEIAEGEGVTDFAVKSSIDRGLRNLGFDLTDERQRRMIADIHESARKRRQEQAAK
jgi:hypothetical protein